MFENNDNMHKPCILLRCTCVQVWDTHRKSSIAPGNERVKKSQLMVEFKGHHYGVQCCAIAPNESVVLSGDIDSCVMVSFKHVLYVQYIVTLLSLGCLG